MAPATTTSLSELYLDDETAWLEEMAQLIARRELEQVDFDNLSSYLNDMALRERREVKRRLTVLLAHLLKWEHQPDRRSRSWRSTIITQRQTLADHAGAGVLRTHAEAVLPAAYANAIERAAAETGLPAGTFLSSCPYELDQLLTIELPEG